MHVTLIFLAFNEEVLLGRFRNKHFSFSMKICVKLQLNVLEKNTQKLVYNSNASIQSKVGVS